MNKYLLYASKSNITAKSLSEYLQIRSTKSVKKLKRLKIAPIIRYGNSKGVFEQDTKVNAPDLIKLVSNSYTFSCWCQEHNFNSAIYLKGSRNNHPDFPFFLRKSHHRAGYDIRIIKNEGDLYHVTDKDFRERYCVPFVPTTFELRIHVVNGKIIRVFKKERNNGNHDLIRVMRLGWHYSIRNNLNERYIKAQEMCLNIMEELGLFFGGIDIAWNKQKGEYIIWEINSAPGLGLNTMELYAKEFDKCLKIL